MPRYSDAEFVAAWQEAGGRPKETARLLAVSERSVFSRRNKLEANGYELPTNYAPPENASIAYNRRINFEAEDGCIFVGNDRHCWPGDGISQAEAAMVHLAPALRPVAIISNGDVFDGARLTRHPSLGHEQKPRVDDEVAAVAAHLDRLAAAVTGWECRLMRTVGNHCMRFDRHIATWGGDMSRLKGMRLRDHISTWDEAWSVHINPTVQGGYTVVKHRQHGGIHAAYNNAVKSGVTIVTGHTHRQDVRPIVDYRGTRWGVQTGMMANRYAPSMEYSEDGPDPGTPGFAVLTWRDAVLQPPELVTVDEAGVAWWRGEPLALRVRVQAGRG